MSALERIAQAAEDAACEVIAGATAGTPILLPRGADPFAGAERPLLLTATRWAAVSPGGVILGGTPEALASVLGFTLPDRPSVTEQDAGQQRRATDHEPEDGEDAAPDGAPDADGSAPAPAPEAEGAPPAASDEDADSGEAPAEPPPARRWSDQAAEAAREPAAKAGDGLIRALAVLVGLPPGAAATHAVLAETEAMVSAAVGPLPDAIVVPLRRDGAEIRLVVVVASILAARVSAAAVQVGSAAGPGAAPVDAETSDTEAGTDAAAGEHARDVDVVPVALGGVPLELSAQIGTTRLPLSSVLALRDGAVLELDEAVDAPVVLVAGTAPVATGELELDETGHLVLHVTAIPGRPDLVAGPSLVAEADEMPPGSDRAEPVADERAPAEPLAADEE